jgi:hypothetical protein
VKRLIREPLLHFFLLGAALFVLYQVIPRAPSLESSTIVVSQGRITSMATTFARVWQRPPTDDELERLVRDYIREEVYYREAVAIGLDRDDSIVRRRLQQKLEFVSEGASSAEPTEEELKAYLAAHADDFRTDRKVTFRQVYLSRQHHGDALARDTIATLAELRTAGAPADIARYGDPSLINQAFKDVPMSEVGKQFGIAFAAKLQGLPTGSWQGPVESPYGLHLVIVDARSEDQAPPLDAVRGAVHRAWADQRRIDGNEKFYRALLENYTVKIEKPK